ncbi:Uncharacterised protein [Burkholderia pseudomallei]|nr:Uncharacterised protein [Burkholderia pseudomallei]CPJ24936.1 Uncharacterised protein [Burkholderia pseudomallei]
MSAMNGGLPGFGCAFPVRNSDCAQTVKNARHAFRPASTVE